MRVAVVSDVHGNGVGLDAVLAELAEARVDRLVCLGDLVEGGPQPDYCLRRVQELGCAVVDGNCDHWLVEYYREPELAERSDIGAWARERLGEDGLAALASFPDTHELGLRASGREALQPVDECSLRQWVMREGIQAVRRVDDSRDGGNAGREPSVDPGLRVMRVDDRGTEPAEHSGELDERPNVVEGGYRPRGVLEWEVA